MENLQPTIWHGWGGLSCPLASHPSWNYVWWRGSQVSLCALDTSATILPFFFSIHIPQHTSHNLHTLSLTLTHLTSHTLTPTLTPSLATIFHTLTLTLTPSLATLKGSTLLLYQCDDITNLSEDAHVDLRLGKQTAPLNCTIASCTKFNQSYEDILLLYTVQSSCVSLVFACL